MTQVALIIWSDPADIYGNMTWVTGNKGFLFPGQRIVDLYGHGYLPLSRGTAANFFLYPNIVSPKSIEVVLILQWPLGSKAHMVKKIAPFFTLPNHWRDVP